MGTVKIWGLGHTGLCIGNNRHLTLPFEENHQDLSCNSGYSKYIKVDQEISDKEDHYTFMNLGSEYNNSVRKKRAEIDSNLEGEQTELVSDERIHSHNSRNPSSFQEQRTRCNKILKSKHLLTWVCLFSMALFMLVSFLKAGPFFSHFFCVALALFERVLAKSA